MVVAQAEVRGEVAELEVVLYVRGVIRAGRARGEIERRAAARQIIRREVRIEILRRGIVQAGIGDGEREAFVDGVALVGAADLDVVVSLLPCPRRRDAVVVERAVRLRGDGGVVRRRQQRES